MAKKIDRVKAETILLASLRANCTKNDEISESIKQVINGSHKTYKYVLVTGLLAMSIDDKLNPLALQKKAPIEGAYDARTLCHKVLVRFEREFLENALGGSNEPFLNKPARFTHLDPSNAVRSGDDKETLNSVIKILSSIKTSEDASAYLNCAMSFIKVHIEELKKLNKVNITYSPTLIEILEFIYKFLEKSFEGESAAIVVATLEKLYHSSLQGDYEVIAHKVNQSGASSKEVGDIDIFKNDAFFFAVEVKDKDFNVNDFQHAMKKIMENKGVKGQFVFGQNAKYDADEISKKINEYEKSGFMVLFIDIYEYSRIMLFKSELTDRDDFIETLMDTAIEINSKEDTRKWIKELTKELKWEE